MNKFFLIISTALLIILTGCATSPKQPVMDTQTRPAEKIYVAIEEEGKVAVIDAAQRQVIMSIDLSEEYYGVPMKFMAHNVQVAPDGKSVWVTANAMTDLHSGHDESATGHGTEVAEIADQVIVIDPYADRIIQRISIAPDSHLAHVVVAPDNTTAYVTAQEEGVVYHIDTATYSVTATTDLGVGSGPHGLRISPDGSQVFIALLDGKALAVLSTADATVAQFPLDSEAVQTAVTPDGKYAFVSLYGTKQVARFDIASQTLDTIDLPAESKGPVQLYATPDSQYLYVADQGYYFDQPTSSVIYRIDSKSFQVDQTIVAGTAPHGVVVDDQGAFVYVTNLLSDDVSIIEVATGTEIARIPVGKMPNGISMWNE